MNRISQYRLLAVLLYGQHEWLRRWGGGRVSFPNSRMRGLLGLNGSELLKQIACLEQQGLIFNKNSRRLPKYGPGVHTQLTVREPAVIFHQGETDDQEAAAETSSGGDEATSVSISTNVAPI